MHHQQDNLGIQKKESDAKVPNKAPKGYGVWGLPKATCMG